MCCTESKQKASAPNGTSQVTSPLVTKKLDTGRSVQIDPGTRESKESHDQWLNGVHVVDVDSGTHIDIPITQARLPCYPP